MIKVKELLKESLQYILDNPEMLYNGKYICTTLHDAANVKDLDVDSIYLIKSEFKNYKPCVNKKLSRFTRNQYYYGGGAWWNLELAKTEGNYDKVIESKLLFIKRVIETIDKELTDESSS